jgi:hypothetical protein
MGSGVQTIIVPLSHKFIVQALIASITVPSDGARRVRHKASSRASTPANKTPSAVSSLLLRLRSCSCSLP